jgi:hypothetical protein
MDFMDGGLVNFQLKEGRKPPQQQQTVHAFFGISLCLACIARELIQRVCSILKNLLPTITVLLTYLLTIHACSRTAGFR